jgi:hypothetical protein
MKAPATWSLVYYDLKQHKPRFHKECSKLSDRKDHAKLQLLQNPNQTNGDDPKNVRRETCRTFRNKTREYLKEKY